MASIRKRGNSYLLVVSMGYDPSGKRRAAQQKTVRPPDGLTPKQKERWLDEQAILFERECRNLPQAVNRNITLAEYTELWLQNVAPNKLAKSTLTRERRDIDRFLPALGHIKLTDLRAEHFRKLYAELRKTKSKNNGKPLSENTVEGVHACLCGILSDAMESGFLDHNPAWRTYRYAGRKCERFIADEETAQRVIAAVENESIKYGQRAGGGVHGHGAAGLERVAECAVAAGRGADAHARVAVGGGHIGGGDRLRGLAADSHGGAARLGDVVVRRHLIIDGQRSRLGLRRAGVEVIGSLGRAVFHDIAGGGVGHSHGDAVGLAVAGHGHVRRADGHSLGVDRHGYVLRCRRVIGGFRRRHSDGGSTDMIDGQRAGGGVHGHGVAACDRIAESAAAVGAGDNGLACVAVGGGHVLGGDGLCVLRRGADRCAAGGRGIVVDSLFDTLIKRVGCAGRESCECRAVLPVRSVLAVLASIHRCQRDAVLARSCRCRRGRRAGRGLGNFERPAVAVEHGCAGGVIIALGNRCADIIGADVLGRCLGGAAGVTVILHRNRAHARHAGRCFNGRSLVAAAVNKVRRCGIGQVGRRWGFLRDDQGDGHCPAGIILRDRGRVPLRRGWDNKHPGDHGEHQYPR
ncbi:MAG: hypothetical protein E7474_07270 [Ruminococcaceae bacterium]|nr:hypothetical protein [Oscillospiraceae bacterium]